MSEMEVGVWYERTRTKIAVCLVGGKTLCISGGNYALCDGSAWRCCGKKIYSRILGIQGSLRFMRLKTGKLPGRR